MEEDEEYFEVCVVGGGVMGSCTAFSLAKAGKNTVLLEQFPLPHTRGSSSGHSRITSLADYTTPHCAPIVKHGYQEWARIMGESTIVCVRLFHPILTVSTDEDFIKAKSKRIETATGYPPIRMDIDKLNERYKSTIPSDRYAVIDHSGVVLIANKCVEAAQKLFVRHGGVLLDGMQVQEIQTPADRENMEKTQSGGNTKEHPSKEGMDKSIKDEDECIRVIAMNTNNRRRRKIIRCSSLVLCPGPWANDLLSKIGVELPLKTLKTGIWYYKLRDPNIPQTNFNDLSIPNSFYYSTPEIEYPGLIKFGNHGGVEVSPEDREKADLSELKKNMAEYLEKFFPQIESEPSIEESCMYTMTPDEEFVLDYHPVHKNIMFACGFSGRGFQFGPAIGEMLTHMVLGFDPIHDLTPFRASRFKDSDKTELSISAASKY